ncbi:hypothetical protein Tco_0644879 [Tanacetum coccineum]
MSRYACVVHEMFTGGVEMLSLYMRCSMEESRPSTPPSDSPGPSRNAECSNCKLLFGKIKVLEATMEIFMHPEQNTLNLTALLHEVYNDMGKLGLE